MTTPNSGDVSRGLRPLAQEGIDDAALLAALVAYNGTGNPYKLVLADYGAPFRDGMRAAITAYLAARPAPPTPTQAEGGGPVHPPIHFDVAQLEAIAPLSPPTTPQAPGNGGNSACPFCGGRVQIDCSSRLGPQWKAWCVDCQAELPYAQSRDLAAALWNRRAACQPSTTTQAALRDYAVSRFNAFTQTCEEVLVTAYDAADALTQAKADDAGCTYGEKGRPTYSGHTVRASDPARVLVDPALLSEAAAELEMVSDYMEKRTTLEWTVNQQRTVAAALRAAAAGEGA